MESIPFLAVLALSLYLWRAGRSLSLGVALAILVLIRPDGAIPLLLIMDGLWVKEPKRAFRALIAAFAVGVIWLPYQWVAIGRLLPDTLSVKIAQGESGLWGHGPIFIKGLAEVLFGCGSGFFIIEAIVGYFAVIGVYLSLRQPALRSTMAVIVGTAVVLFLAYAAMNVPAYPWYYTVGVYAATVAAGIGIQRCVSGVLKFKLEHRTIGWGNHFKLISACGAGLVLMLSGWQVTPTTPARLGYIAAAEWLDRNASPSATVTSAEIGILGFYSHRVTLDYLGLVKPEAVAPMSRGDMTWWVNGLHPDYWMAHRVPWLKFETPVVTASWFHNAFREVYTNEEVVIYRRIGASP